jgi:hypothetical protein
VSWLVDLLGVYGRVLRRAVELTLKHWWLGPVAIGYQVLVLALMAALAPFGMVGGFIVTIGMAALMSSWMVLVGNVVRNGRVTFADVPQSFAVHLGDVVTFFFLLWVLNTIAGLAFQDLALAAIVFELASFVFLNAVPEQIYLGGNAGTAVFVESYRFIGTYWIEWLPMTAALALLVLVAASVPFPPLALALGGIAFALMSIARGLLFLELTTSSRRAREFARRTAG